jgi:hypothetical protein
VFVEEDPQEHAEHAEDIDLETEAQRQFHQDQVNRKRRVDAGSKVGRKDTLNRALGCHDMENFSKDTAEQPTDDHKDQ